LKKHIFSGCATALITPFTDDGKDVDIKAFEKLIGFQLDNNADALVVAGTTGESPVITSEEKALLFKTACNMCSDKIPVIAGTGSNNTQEAVRKSNDAEKQGVDGLLIVTPYYNKCTQEGIIEHYFYIADRVSAPIIVYNVPSRTGVSIAPETYKILAEHKNISGIKEAGNNVSDFIKTVTLCEDNADIFSGNDDMTVCMMAMGAKGVISVASNIIPDIMHRITANCAEGNFKVASDLLKKHLNLINLMFCEVNPAPVKSACNLLFDIKERLRLPLTNISQMNKQKIANALHECKLLT